MGECAAEAHGGEKGYAGRPKRATDAIMCAEAGYDGRWIQKARLMLERKRDECLVATLRGLRESDFAAGAVLDRYVRGLGKNARGGTGEESTEAPNTRETSKATEDQVSEGA